MTKKFLIPIPKQSLKLLMDNLPPTSQFADTSLFDAGVENVILCTRGSLAEHRHGVDPEKWECTWVFYDESKHEVVNGNK